MIITVIKKIDFSAITILVWSLSLNDNSPLSLWKKEEVIQTSFVYVCGKDLIFYIVIIVFIFFV